MCNISCLKTKRAITILEYVLLFAALIAAMMAAQVFLRRALSFKWKETADSFGYGRQYIADGERATTIVNR